MPSLRQLTCSIQWASTGTAFQEHGTQYGDGTVETYICVPNDEPQPFTIRLCSNNFIHEGLAMVVFIDGQYHVNRNRVNLRPPRQLTAEEAKDEDVVAKNKKSCQIDFVVRQKEKSQGDGMYMGRGWRFDDHNIVEDGSIATEDDHFKMIGNIEVLVLRCQSRNPIDITYEDSSSAEDSEVVHRAQVPDYSSQQNHISSLSTQATGKESEVSKSAQPEIEEVVEDGIGGLFGLFDGANDQPEQGLWTDPNTDQRPWRRHFRPAYAYPAPNTHERTHSFQANYQQASHMNVERPPSVGAQQPYPGDGKWVWHQSRTPAPLGHHFNAAREKPRARPPQPAGHGASDETHVFQQTTRPSKHVHYDHGPTISNAPDQQQSRARGPAQSRPYPRDKAYAFHARPPYPSQSFDQQPNGPVGLFHYPSKETSDHVGRESAPWTSSERYYRDDVPPPKPDTYQEYRSTDGCNAREDQPRIFTMPTAHDFAKRASSQVPPLPAMYNLSPPQHVRSTAEPPYIQHGRQAFTSPRQAGFHMSSLPVQAAHMPAWTVPPFDPRFYPWPYSAWHYTQLQRLSLGNEGVTPEQYHHFGPYGPLPPRAYAGGAADGVSPKTVPVQGIPPYQNPAAEGALDPRNNSNATNTRVTWSQAPNGPQENGSGWGQIWGTRQDQGSNEGHGSPNRWNGTKGGNGNDTAGPNQDQPNGSGGNSWAIFGDTSNGPGNINNSWQDAPNDQQAENTANDWTNDTTQDNNNTVWADDGQGKWSNEVANNNDAENSWHDATNQKTSDVAQAPTTCTAEAASTIRRTYYGPFGPWQASGNSYPDGPPPDAEEEPRFDVPRAIAEDYGSTKQVVAGPGYLYHKKSRAVSYFDTLAEPYARFVFIYRTRDQIRAETGIEVELEPSPDEQINQLQQLDKQSLVDRIAMYEQKYGKLSSPQIKQPAPATSDAGKAPSRFKAPDRSFLEYGELPSRPPRPVKVKNGNAGSSSNNTGSPAWNSTSDIRQSNGQKDVDNTWTSGGNNDKSWETNNNRNNQRDDVWVSGGSNDNGGNWDSPSGGGDEQAQGKKDSTWTQDNSQAPPRPPTPPLAPLQSQDVQNPPDVNAAPGFEIPPVPPPPPSAPRNSVSEGIGNAAKHIDTAAAQWDTAAPAGGQPQGGW